MGSADYPRMLFRYGHEPVTVQTEDEEAAALGAGWSRTYPPREEVSIPPEPPPAEPSRRARKRV